MRVTIPGCSSMGGTVEVPPIWKKRPTKEKRAAMAAVEMRNCHLPMKSHSNRKMIFTPSIGR